MARIRTIKPEFFTSEDIVGMSPHARLLYIALWCEADRAGRMKWKPRTFKMRYMPGDEVDINALCEEIVGAGLVHLYGDGLACIPKFDKHQHVNPRETNSSYPAPEDVTRGNADSRVHDASARVSDTQGGREGKERNARRDATGVSEMFERFWSAYPKKVSKGTAEKSFAKIKPDAALLQNILSAVERAKASDDWKKEGGQYIPHPATWLNGKRWEDECGEGSSPQSVGGIFAGAL